MAAAAPSPLASCVEKTNGAKLSRLLIDGGTTVLRNIFDGFHSPPNLAAGLNANYPTLNTLLKKKVLRTVQWDQLFPPGGATPDSKTFDITLLFLLLTNICGLFPPPLGWHIIPPPSDNSLEANLIRIKFFRNELYGHVSTTGVDTPTFNALWQEISAVLVALGLNQAEIDRLEAELCGEEDYLDVLLDWANSEEDIMSQLKDIRQYLATTQHEILEDSKSKLDKMYQTQINVQETVEKVRQTQLEDNKTLQDNKSKLDKVHQTQMQTLKTAEKVRQTQQEDHETLLYSKSKLADVYDAQTKTQDTTEKVRQTQLEDRETLQDSKSKLDEIQETQTKTQQVVQGVVKTQEEHFKTLQAVRQTVDSFKEGSDADRKEDQVLLNLAKSEFKGDIEYHLGRYQEGTREWVFNEVENWLCDRNCENRVMVISANAGMGKSVISAVLCKIMQEDGRLAGSHFCQHSNARYRNPQLMLQSLACHLSHALSEYKQALVKQLSRNLGKDLNSMGVEELFGLLFKEPLSSVADPGRNMLMVIDGLDESEYQERNELLDVIASHFCKLPCWIRFVCTTRPERTIAEALKYLKPLELESNDEKNIQDIKQFLEKRIQYRINPAKKGAIVEKLVEKSEGLMLYAYFLVSFIEEDVSVLDQGDLDGSLPLAISSVYHSYFKRLENELKELGVKEDNFLNLLCIVTASREPLPIGFLSKLLVPNANSPLARRKVLHCIGSVSSLLPIRDGCLQVIHKSVKDWLTDASCYGEHDFTMDEKEGHRILARLCADELDNLKQKGVHHVEFSSTLMYALHHGVRHMLQLNECMRSRGLEKCVQRYVVDLELLYAKLCVNNSIAAEDILWLLQSQDLAQVLSRDSKDLLEVLIFLLRKYFNTVTNHPYVFFETVLNKGGAVLSSVASNLLRTKYPEIPYMELVHKEMQQGALLARFQCWSQVACLDVSQQLDYMVCECKDGTIQLWSLHTGKLVWVRPVMVKKLLLDLFGAYRAPLVSSVLSFYRSVVFHPTEEVVLPGVLSHAYTFEGELRPLFPNSNCTFTVCSISGDMTRMLTDCPDDAKCIIMWSLEDGSEIARTTRSNDVLSFTWSRDGRFLAMTYSTGLICLVDVMDGFRTIVETAIPAVCGMIKCSTDFRSLFCFSLAHSTPLNLVRLRISLVEHPSCMLYVFDKSEPWQFESPNEAGFLLGDPISFRDGAFDFALNKETVLRCSPYRSFIDMLNVNELWKSNREPTITVVKEIVLSLSGKTVYVLSGAAKPTVRALDAASGELMAEKHIENMVVAECNHSLVAVKEGVLFATMDGLVLWSYELSRCVRNLTHLYRIHQVVSISEEQVACVCKEWTGEIRVIVILDTTSGEILSTIPIGRRRFVSCNSKIQLLTCGESSLRLSDDKTTLWKKRLSSPLDLSNLPGMFSLAETFVVIWAKTPERDGEGMYVLDAVSGDTLRILCRCKQFFDCKFVSDVECVVSSQATSGGYCVRLFNVKSGDLLSVIDLERKVNRLAACPRERLLAITESNSKLGYNLIHVQLPQDRDRRKSKRLNNAPQIEKRKENKRDPTHP